MTWYAVVDRTTGEAVSFGTTVASRLAAHLEAVPINHQPGEGERWDAATRTIGASRATDPMADEYAAAVVTDQKVDVIAKRLALKL